MYRAYKFICVCKCKDIFVCVYSISDLWIETKKKHFYRGISYLYFLYNVYFMLLEFFLH